MCIPLSVKVADYSNNLDKLEIPRWQILPNSNPFSLFAQAILDDQYYKRNDLSLYCMKIIL